MTLIGLWAWVQASSHQEDFKVTQPVADPATGSKTLRDLALGDSYTLGERVTVNERWPNLLADLLRRDGVMIEPPRMIAVRG